MPPRPVNFSRRARQLRAASLKWSRRVAAERKALGLTTRGTVRQHQQHPDLHGLPEKVQHKLRAAQRRAAFAARGLTSRGTSRVAHYASYPELGALRGRDRALARMRAWYYRRVNASARSAVKFLLQHSR
jgi:hypothetical protein